MIMIKLRLLEIENYILAGSEIFGLLKYQGFFEYIASSKDWEI